MSWAAARQAALRGSAAPARPARRHATRCAACTPATGRRSPGSDAARVRRWGPRTWRAPCGTGPGGAPGGAWGARAWPRGRPGPGGAARRCHHRGPHHHPPADGPRQGRLGGWRGEGTKQSARCDQGPYMTDLGLPALARGRPSCGSQLRGADPMHPCAVDDPSKPRTLQNGRSTMFTLAPATPTGASRTPRPHALTSMGSLPCAPNAAACLPLPPPPPPVQPLGYACVHVPRAAMQPRSRRACTTAVAITSD